MSKFKELLEKIEDADLKNALDAEMTALSREKGEAGRKLFEKDSEVAKLKEQVSEAASYREAFKVLKEQGVDAKAIPSMLEKMKVTKTLEDDLYVVTQTLKEKDKELNDLKTFKKTREIRDTVGKYLAEEMANFKDEDGKQIKVLDRFIPEDKLYADIDISNEVLIRERVKSVLKDGLQAQEAVRKDLGYQGRPLHTVPEAQGGVGGGQNVVAQLQKTFKEAGPVAALSEFYKMSQG